MPDKLTEMKAQLAAFDAADPALQPTSDLFCEEWVGYLRSLLPIATAATELYIDYPEHRITIVDYGDDEQVSECLYCKETWDRWGNSETHTDDCPMGKLHYALKVLE